MKAEHSTHIRHVLLYEFESGHPAAEAHRNLSQAFVTEAPSERSVRAWFQRFKAGNKKLEDEPRSGRPTAVSFDELKDLSEQHPYESVRLGYKSRISGSNIIFLINLVTMSVRLLALNSARSAGSLTDGDIDDLNKSLDDLRLDSDAKAPDGVDGDDITPVVVSDTEESDSDISDDDNDEEAEST
ncbi:hypothetical protein NECAME_09669 [Necator americanus]|uniref:Mos1 transposase HTH domain-containing protein n=1 Tax=Necator americanus TaxID=51031 RepID=W2TCA6_NECAM|nr:hypothetical protein NECAME_09669 [Necator americanus]ETN79685.1 hypothetical protein NECAME_09669 [Necator americanus]